MTIYHLHYKCHNLYIQDYNLEPDFVVDITPHMDKKMETIFAFKTQFWNPDADPNSKELASPITAKSFIDFIQSKNRSFGRHAGFEFAEGFNVARTIGVEDLFDLH